MTKKEDLETMSLCDLMHYSREQRKFVYDNYEKFKHHDDTLTWQTYVKHILPTIIPNFHQQYMKRHLSAREYLATGYQK